MSEDKVARERVLAAVRTRIRTDQFTPVLLHLGACRVHIEPVHVSTVLPTGDVIDAVPHDTDAYRATALDRGYGDDTARMNRCHEVAHSLLAHWLGQPASVAFTHIAAGNWKHMRLTHLEEAAVEAIERYANALGVDLVARACAVSAP